MRHLVVPLYDSGLISNTKYSRVFQFKFEKRQHPELLTENGYRESLVVDLYHSETLTGNTNKLLAGASQQSVFALLKLEVVPCSYLRIPFLSLLEGVAGSCGLSPSPSKFPEDSQLF